MFNFKIGSLSRDVFERRTSTESGLFALLSRNFENIFGQIVSIRVKKNLALQIWWPQGILKEKKTHFWLTFVPQKCISLNSLLKVSVCCGHSLRYGKKRLAINTERGLVSSI